MELPRRYYLTVAKILPVYLDEGGTAVLTPGESSCLPARTDRTPSSAPMTAAPDRSGWNTMGEGGWTINGESEENFFEMLPYVG